MFSTGIRMEELPAYRIIQEEPHLVQTSASFNPKSIPKNSTSTFDHFNSYTTLKNLRQKLNTSFFYSHKVMYSAKKSFNQRF